MYIKLITLIILIGNIGQVFAKEPFAPNIVEPNVCKLVLDHYTKLYESKEVKTSGTIESKDVFNPEFDSREIEGIYGNIKTTKITIDGVEKDIVYHQRWHSWRGEISTGYMIDQNQTSILEEQLKSGSDDKIKPFYPMGKLAYGSDFSWWENMPFQYENNWYVLEDFGDFYRHNSMRSIHKLSLNGTTKKVCTIKIFENFSPKNSGQDFPFFTAYKEAVEEITLSTGHCGTSHPEAYAESSGKLYASMSIIRPWAIVPTWQSGNNSWEVKDFQRKHFDDWKYQDIWSYREFKTHANTKLDAINELKVYYINNYEYSTEDAEKLASAIIDSMPGAYYSLGVYYGANQDTSFLQKLVDGTYNNWENLENNLKLLKVGYQNIPHLPLTILSLLVDNPKMLKELPDTIKQNDIKTFYEKDFLMFAAHMNNYDSVKYLVKQGWPINNLTEWKSDSICDPKMERNNRSALTYAAENASIELIQYLIANGSDINITDTKGNSLDFYINKNPRFTAEEKKLGFEEIVKKYPKSSNIQPSFSCDVKLNNIEKAICSSEGLSIYDRELLQVYKKAISHENIVKQVKKSQIKWIKKRNHECSQFKEQAQINACIARKTRARIRYLEYVDSVFNK
ncbi:ankyrin repeat domain-containing protein [Sulfurimonas sp.]|uniref:ankyrin repeat domain-containing protein n=1 Tax=Sulfurimonas sp. TaxID=2022749 RepID=UPI002AB0FD67|nr:ankyrin repeat domain-containing protein [Sulfurimonas sp.]